MTRPSNPRFKDSQIDWYKFLNRPRMPQPSAETLSSLRNSSILITGAGGSIGSALSLRLAALRPRSLVLLESSEQALYRLQSQLHAQSSPDPSHIYLGSTSDSALLDEIFLTHNPGLIFHAAAYKHLSLLEHHPLAAILNNTLATLSLINRASRQRNIPAPRIVLLSTDKAADPESILGASKRIAEQIVTHQNGIAFRLANVLGSDGSVVERFLSQIANNQPLTISHPQASRYFLTPEEAVDMLLSVAAQSLPGSLLVPPLHTPHSIVGLTAFLSQELSPTHPIARTYIGLKPGEKLTETLWSRHESPMPADASCCIPLINSAANPTTQPGTLKWAGNLARLQRAVEQRDIALAIQITLDLVPGYSPSTSLQQAASITLESAHP